MYRPQMYRPLFRSRHYLLLLPPSPQQYHIRGLVSLLCWTSPQRRSCWRSCWTKNTSCNFQQPSSRFSLQCHQLPHRRLQPVGSSPWRNRRSCPVQPWDPDPVVLSAAEG